MEFLRDFVAPHRGRLKLPRQMKRYPQRGQGGMQLQGCHIFEKNGHILLTKSVGATHEISTTSQSH
jgi:hypothetical protein